MSVLIDTNVLVRRVEPVHPHHAAAIIAVDRLLLASEPVYVTLQNLTEAWRAMTGPKGANGLGFEIAVAQAELGRIERLFALLDEDVPAITAEWKRLVLRHQVIGLQVYDARLAAAMIVHSIDRILTFNAADFTRYGVTVLDPAAVS